ncbi:MAG: hypothetical protein AB1428_09475 [Bacteroidota bacterium]
MTETNDRRAIVEDAIARGNGILRLKPAWVARTFLPPGRRFGLPEPEYNLGARGAICERWLASTTIADNKVRIPDEGLSFLALDSHDRMTLKEAVELAGPSIMGAAYAATHKTLDRLAKIFDYRDRLPYHFHQMKYHAALVGRNPKEEAYYFPEGVEMGPHPESFLGVHPSVTAQRQFELFLPHLQQWNSDRILQYSRAYLLVPGDGFHIPAGTLHAPGSALTIELQEDSDVLSMLQARVSGYPIDKELLFKDVRPEDRQKYGERVILDMIDWETSGDPFFYENRHTPPRPVEGGVQEGGEETWIFYNTHRFSGKRLEVKPGKSYTSTDHGVYNILVWQGSGRVDGHRVAGGNPAMDELMVCHDKAVTPFRIENTGTGNLVLFKFFGPDVNPDVPMLKQTTGT